jgi:imidazolonepropionase
LSTTAIDNIGLLVTGDPEFGDEPLGVVRDAAVVMEDDRVVAIAGAGADADRRIDAGGRCVIPGFVDSHTHLVFAGDRAEEFAARMAGAPYAAGGIRSTVAQTKSAPGEELRRLMAVRRRDALRAGITHVEIKSGYALDVEGERRLCELSGEITDDVTFLGAHVLPSEYEDQPDDYVSLVCGEMLDACAPHARWIDVFCERGAFDADQSRAVLEAGRRAGLGLRIHANQLGLGPGVRVAVEAGAASADHCTHLSRPDIEALAGSDTVATLLPATDFSTRQPYANARRLIDAGATVALATNCNPGSSYTTSMSFCIALAVREMRMTAEEALMAATVGGATALRRPELGRLRPGSRADAVVLSAPSYLHIIYRAGMPLVAATVARGQLEWVHPELGVAVG